MASLIEGYEYDIFISYRQKDNKGDRWVSDFVDALRIELDKTFKEEISVYFDVNPHDGIPATHDAAASFREKLKCLVFIPVVSRTYCDPKSYEWENEFKAFVEMASRDQFGLKVKLPDGNVAGRVLPVWIHDLENADIRLCESVLGGVLRGVEFIYKEPGVNRPLTSADNEKKNLNGTKYKDQINRAANAIEDIISGLKAEPSESGSLQTARTPAAEKSYVQEKSIIVLPFENLSPDPDQEYFSEGLTEEVISDLSLIPDLLVISRSSAMTFKGSRSTIREIADRVNVRYVLEGSVRKASNNLRITAQLIDSANDSHIWADKYMGTLEDVFDIQEKVSQSIVGALKIKLSSTAREKIHERPIDNVFAYDCYKRAYSLIISYRKERIDQGLKLLQKGLEISGENAVIYAGMAFAYFQLVNAGIDQEKNLGKAEDYVQKAFSLDPGLAKAHFVMGCIYALHGNLGKAMEHATRALAGKPEDPEIMIWVALGYSIFGKTELAKSIIDRCVIIDPLNPLNDSVIGRNYFFSGRFDLALDPLLAAYSLSPESGMNQFWKSLILLYNNRADEAYEFISESVREPGRDTWTQLTVFLKYVIKGEKDKLESLLAPDFIRTHKSNPQNSYNIAAFYSYLNDKEKSLEWLENAVERGFINYPFLNEYDPLLENIRGEERFRILMNRVRYESESYRI
jgi:TolB-like protein/tetratricopeptide (TPR) repeat protein